MFLLLEKYNGRAGHDKSRVAAPRRVPRKRPDCRRN
jgi:hypothetical protein